MNIKCHLLNRCPLLSQSLYLQMFASTLSSKNLLNLFNLSVLIEWYLFLIYFTSSNFLMIYSALKLTWVTLWCYKLNFTTIVSTVILQLALGRHQVRGSEPILIINIWSHIFFHLFNLVWSQFCFFKFLSILIRFSKKIAIWILMSIFHD